jgi:hypothetical protein
MLKRGWEVRREPRTVRLNPQSSKLRTVQTGILERRFSNGLLRRESAHDAVTWSICSDSGMEIRTWNPEPFHPQWIDIDARGRVVFADKGCLWAWSNPLIDNPTKISDLTLNQFVAIEPPDWATSW